MTQAVRRLRDGSEEGRVQTALADIDASLALYSFQLRSADAQAGEASVEGSAICASLRRDEQSQWFFVQIFNVLVALIAAGTLGLLLVGLWQAASGATIAALLEGAAAVVTGLAAKWLLDRQKEARAVLRAIQRALHKYKCEAA